MGFVLPGGDDRNDDPPEAPARGGVHFLYARGLVQFLTVPAPGIYGLDNVFERLIVRF